MSKKLFNWEGGGKEKLEQTNILNFHLDLIFQKDSAAFCLLPFFKQLHKRPDPALHYSTEQWSPNFFDRATLPVKKTCEHPPIYVHLFLYKL